MAREATYTAELGVHQEGATVSALVTFETTVVHGGLRSYKCDSGTGGTSQYVTAGIAPTGAVWRRAWFRFAHFPTTAAAFIMCGTSQTVGTSVRLTSGGDIQYWRNNGGGVQIGSSFAVSLNTWYCIELYSNFGAGATDQGECRITPDGGSTTTIGTLVNGDVGTDATENIRFGWVYNATIDRILYVDDIAINSSTGTLQNTWAGPGTVVLALPISDAARGAKWNAGAGATTNLWDAVNNIPPAGVLTTAATNTSQIEHIGSATAAGEAYDANLPTYTALGVPSGGTVEFVQLIAFHGEDLSTGTKLLTFAGVSNPVIASSGNIVAGLDAGPIQAFPSAWTKYTSPPVSGAGVNLAVGPVIRVTRPETAARSASVCLLALFVEWLPPSGPPDTPISGSDAVNLDADETASSPVVALAPANTLNLDSDEVGSLAPIAATATGPVNLDSDHAASLVADRATSTTVNLDSNEVATVDTGPAQVLAILTPGDSRSQTTDPLAQSAVGTPATVAGPFADSAWDLDGTEEVRFTAQAAEIGASYGRGGIAVWYRRSAGTTEYPELITLGDYGTGAAMIAVSHDLSLNRFTVFFFNAAGSTQLTVHIPHSMAVGDWALVEVGWTETSYRGSVNAGTAVTGVRTATPATTTFGNIVRLGLADSAPWALTVGPALIANAPLTDAEIDCLVGRTVSWELDMAPGDWCGPLDASKFGSDTVNLDSNEAGVADVGETLQYLPVSSNIDVDDLGSLAAALPSADSANLDADESASLATALSGSAPANIDADEAGSLVSAPAAADTANLDANELSSLTVASASAHSANIDADEAGALAFAPSSAHSANLDADEAGSLASAASSAHSVNLDADEASSVAVQHATADAALLTVTESAITAIVDLKAAADAAALDSNELSTLASAQSRSDTANLDADESASVAVSVAGSDAALIDTDETGTSSVAHAATAPVALTATEAGSVLIGLQEVFGVDAVNLASTETGTTDAILSGTDTANLDVDELGALAPLAVTASDVVTLTSTEAGSSAIDTLPVSASDLVDLVSTDLGLVGTATLSASDPVSLDSDETGSPDASVAGSHAAAIQVGEFGVVDQLYLIPADDAANLGSVESGVVAINEDPEPLPTPVHLVIAPGAAPVGLSRHVAVPFTVVRLAPPAPALVRGTLASIQITRGTRPDRSLIRGSSPAPVMLPPTATLSDPPAPALVRGSPWPIQIVRGTTSAGSVVLPLTVVLLEPPSRALVRGAPGSLQIVRGAPSDRALVRGSSSAPVVLRRGREE